MSSTVRVRVRARVWVSKGRVRVRVGLGSGLECIVFMIIFTDIGIIIFKARALYSAVPGHSSNPAKKSKKNHDQKLEPSMRLTASYALLSTLPCA